MHYFILCFLILCSHNLLARGTYEVIVQRKNSESDQQQSKDVTALLKERCEAIKKAKEEGQDITKDEKGNPLPQVNCDQLEAATSDEKESETDTGRPPYVVTPDHKEHEIATLLKEKCDALEKEKVNADFLKDKKYDDVFYVPIKLIRPNITRFPYLSLQLQLTALSGDKPRLGKKLAFDNGKAYRDKHAAKHAIIAPQHQYLVYTGDPHDLLHDVLVGAKTMPVRIIKDHSALHSEAEFWKLLQKDEDAYLKDLEGKEMQLPVRVDDIKDENYLNHWLILFPEIFHFQKPPHQRIYGYVEYPAGIRVQADAPKFAFYELTKQLYAEDFGNFRDPIFMKRVPASYDLEFQKELQRRMHKAFYQGDVWRVNWVHTFFDETKFADAKLFEMTGTKGQILVMSKMPERDLPENKNEEEKKAPVAKKEPQKSKQNNAASKAKRKQAPIAEDEEDADQANDDLDNENDDSDEVDEDFEDENDDEESEESDADLDESSDDSEGEEENLDEEDADEESDEEDEE